MSRVEKGGLAWGEGGGGGVVEQEQSEKRFQVQVLLESSQYSSAPPISFPAQKRTLRSCIVLAP